MIELENKIQNLDKLINKHTMKLSNSDCNSVKKSYEIFIELLVNQKLKIQQTIDELRTKKEFEMETKRLFKEHIMLKNENSL